MKLYIFFCTLILSFAETKVIFCETFLDFINFHTIQNIIAMSLKEGELELQKYFMAVHSSTYL